MSSDKEVESQRDNLAMLCRGLIHKLRLKEPDSDLAKRGLDYLRRKGLQGSPLRDDIESSPSATDARNTALEAAARVIERRAEDRLHATASYDNETGAWDYPRHAEDVGNALDEEADDCAKAIRALKNAATQEATAKASSELDREAGQVMQSVESQPHPVPTQGSTNGPACAAPCTCHPDDNPPVPCPRKYALSACRAAAASFTPPRPSAGSPTRS